MKKPKAIYVDGGLASYSTFGGPHGNGYAKINTTTNDRQELHLPTYESTNNEAELFAILFGIAECIKTECNLIYGDSEWSVKSVKGLYKTKEPRLKLMVDCIYSLLQYYKIDIQWIGREKNLAT